MKLFRIILNSEPASPEESIVLAETEERAKEICDVYNIEDYFTSIEEIDITKEQSIYTGYNCC